MSKTKQVWVMRFEGWLGDTLHVYATKPTEEDILRAVEGLSKDEAVCVIFRNTAHHFGAFTVEYDCRPTYFEEGDLWHVDLEPGGTRSES